MIELLQPIIAFIAKQPNKMTSKQQFIVSISIILMTGGYFFYNKKVEMHKEELMRAENAKYQEIIHTLSEK